MSGLNKTDMFNHERYSKGTANSRTAGTANGNIVGISPSNSARGGAIKFKNNKK